jgi:hypothetical protein
VVQQIESAQAMAILSPFRVNKKVVHRFCASCIEDDSLKALIAGANLLQHTFSLDGSLEAEMEELLVIYIEKMFSRENCSILAISVVSCVSVCVNKAEKRAWITSPKVMGRFLFFLFFYIYYYFFRCHR